MKSLLNATTNVIIINIISSLIEMVKTYTSHLL